MINVVCLKWGDKYSSNYVNRLFFMVKKNITHDFNFFCLTDDSEGLVEEVKSIDLPNLPLHGWWFKLYLFKKNCLGLENGSRLLFLDLDVIITGSLDPVISYSENALCISSDINEFRYNSSVLCFKVGQFSFIWDSFFLQMDWVLKKMHGDQDWIEYVYKNATIYPKSLIKSFKIDLDSKTPFSFGVVGKRLRLMFPFLRPRGEVSFPNNTSIVLFHGKPDPEDVMIESYDKYKKASWISEIYSSLI